MFKVAVIFATGLAMSDSSIIPAFNIDQENQEKFFTLLGMQKQIEIADEVNNQKKVELKTKLNSLIEQMNDQIGKLHGSNGTDEKKKDDAANNNNYNNNNRN